MSPFEEFSELVERVCFNSWRSSIGREDSETSRVSSILFTKEELGGVWRFSFALRVDGRWYQSQCETEPVEYDPYDPPPIDEFDPKRSVSPQNLASSMAGDMLVDVYRRIYG